MEIPSESFNILGILCYLNFPNYLKKIQILSITNIFDKMEEEIEETAIQVEELENSLSNIFVMLDEKDTENVLKIILSKKETIFNLKKQLNFLK
jgi:vacuolar-type H+-ATPase subunit D/Vma8